MQIAQVLAGYTLGGADLLRRAMGKKIQSEMDAQRQQFVAGATERGVERPRAELIFDQMAKFAGYGFNKSHAAAYALVAYQTAYLKANHPVEFLAASMTLDLGNTDKLDAFPPGTRPARHHAAAARHQPLGGRPSRSRPTRRPGKPAIRYALAAVKGVGAQAMADLVAERDAQRPVQGPVRFRARGSTPKASTAASSKASSRPAPSTASTRTGRRASPPPSCCCARRAAPPRSARAGRRTCSPASIAGFAARPSLPLVAGLAAGREAAARIRRDRLLPVEPPARPVRQEPGARRHPALGRSAGGARRECQHPLPPRRHRDRQKERTSARGNRFAFVQLSDTSRHVRGHGVLGGAGAVARAAR